jgi:hypothetical protein
MSTESTNIFLWKAQATNIFHGYALDYIKSRAETTDSVARELSVQLWSVNQRTTEAEVTDS